MAQGSVLSQFHLYLSLQKQLKAVVELSPWYLGTSGLGEKKSDLNSGPLDVHRISGVFLPWGIFNSLTLHFKAQLYWVPAQCLVVNLE